MVVEFDVRDETRVRGARSVRVTEETPLPVFLVGGPGGGAVEVPAGLEATGDPDETTFLRGDGSWATPTDTNTTYSPVSQANIENPASTAAGLVTGQRAAQAVAAYLAANPLLTVPTPPSEGNYTLKSADGVVSWVEDPDDDSGE